MLYAISWKKIFLYILLIFFCIVLYKNTQSKTYESLVLLSSLSQAPYVFKSNEEIYDKYYTEIYDTIYCPEYTVRSELRIIIKQTQITPSSSRTIFLDIGSKTGYTVNTLHQMGFRSFGVDLSQDMINYSENKYPEINVKCEDVLNPMCYEFNLFTHILMNSLEIYHYKNKAVIIKNIYSWLNNGGFLIMHLVNPNKFDITPPSNKDFISQILFHEFKDKSLDKSYLKFNDFDYYISKKSNKLSDIPTTIISEKIIYSNGNIRENEQILYTEKIETIIRYTKNVGFSLIGEVNIQNIYGEGHYLYILQK